MDTNDEVKFNRVLDRLMRSRTVCKMKEFHQHVGTSTFRHCENVARYSFHLAQKFGWNIDEESLAMGAMLHDYYLYNTDEMSCSAYTHSFNHPKAALENALVHFDLNDKERNIILSRMWPLGPLTMPHSQEAVLVQLADKYCALREMCSESESKQIDPNEKTPWIRMKIKSTVRKAIA